MTKHIFPPLTPITGSGGGRSKGGGGSQQGAVEAPNTLHSNARARIVELLGEGQIGGLVDGARSIFFDKTPLQNSDGSFNFNGVVWEQRVGLPDQDFLYGFTQAETFVSVETQVRAVLPPVVRTISDANADAVRITMRIPSLVEQDNTNGNLNPNSVSYRIEVRPNGGAWTLVEDVEIFNQKTTSAYQRAHRVELPVGGHPWDIRVTRTYPDATTANVQNETWWESYTILVEGKFTYPNSAVIATSINAQQFGSNIPQRTFDVRGLLIEIPSNYNPVSRTYSGIWDGTFVTAWTNNPAWILYDLLTNNRYGLGEFIDATKVDKWGLYTIGQYCDQMVPDGFGGTEPRFTFNGVLNSREEAFNVIQQITTAFRGMAYWNLGQVFAVADMPVDAGKLVTPANVIGGKFEYSGTAMKARHTVALVAWNDPQDFYSTAIELVQDDEALQRYGWRETEVQATGCTSRGQAHRLGKWILDTEQNETETITYEASWDHADVVPGTLINVADPRKAEVRAGGRLVETNPLSDPRYFTLDAPFEPTPGETYSAQLVLPDGSLFTSAISAFSLGNTRILLTTAPPSRPIDGSVWVITGSDLAPRQYRVISVAETDKHTIRVTGLFHDPTKYARVESGINLAPIPYTRPRYTVLPPTNLTIVESQYRDITGLPRSRVSLSWTPPNNFIAAGYLITAQTPNGFMNYGQTALPQIDINDLTTGAHTFYVATLARDGRQSPPAEITYTVIGFEGVGASTVTGMEIDGRAPLTTWIGKDVRINWTNVFPGSNLEFPQQGGVNPYYSTNVVRVYDTDTDELLHVGYTVAPTYVYTYSQNLQDNRARSRTLASRRLRFEVTIRDAYGRESAPAVLSVSNPPPALITPTVTAGYEAVFINYTYTANEEDFAGVKIWVSPTTGFNPLITPADYTGVNNFVSVKKPNGTYYVRMGAYDTFGEEGMTISAEITVTVASVLIDTTPPSAPTGLTLTSTLQTNAVGDVTTTLRATIGTNPSTNFGYNQFEIRQGSGNWIAFESASNIYEWPGLPPATSFGVRVRAVQRDGFYPSGYTSEVTHTTAAKTTAPANVTGLVAAASIRTAFISWTAVADTDISHYEVWMKTTNVTPNPVTEASARIGTVYGTSFTHSGLTTGTTYYYWIRAVNTSGIVSAAFSSSATVTTASAANGDIADLAITAGKIAAGTITSDRIAAGTIQGDRISTSTALPGTITVGATGVSLSTVESRAADPAARVNVGSTTIDPGKVLISGATTLANWRNGGDATKIEGGSIAANTISANKLTVGLRGLDIAGIQFTFNAGTNNLAWSAGTIIYIDAAGVSQTQAISAGNATWTSGTMYVYWTLGNSTLTTSTTVTAADGANSIRLATYQGGTNLVATYGRTIIDGSQITTGSITATQIAAGTIQASNIASGTITTNLLAAGNINFDRMAGGTISSDVVYLGSDRFQLDGVNRNMVIRDENGIVRARIGRLGAGANNYGVQFYDGSGNLLFQTGGTILSGNEEASTNMLYNSAFNTSLAGWAAGTNNTTLVYSSGRNQSSNYTLLGGATAFMTVAGTPAVSTIFETENLNHNGSLTPVEPNRRYQFNIYAQALRCNAVAVIKWYDNAGTFISETVGTSITATVLTQANRMSDYTVMGVFGTAPATAYTCRLTVRALSLGALANPTVYFTRGYFGEASAAQTLYNRWAPGPTDLMQQINSGNIGTYIASAAIQSAQIADAAITTAKIGTAQIATANIIDANITNLKVANGAITGGSGADGSGSASVTFTVRANARVAFIATANGTDANTGTTSPVNAMLRLYIGGVEYRNSNQRAFQGGQYLDSGTGLMVAYFGTDSATCMQLYTHGASASSVTFQATGNGAVTILVVEYSK